MASAADRSSIDLLSAADRVARGVAHVALGVVCVAVALAIAIALSLIPLAPPLILLGLSVLDRTSVLPKTAQMRHSKRERPTEYEQMIHQQAIEKTVFSRFNHDSPNKSQSDRQNPWMEKDLRQSFFWNY